MSLEMVFASGLLTGFASSLHCAGLCGGIAAVLVPERSVAGATSTGGQLRFLIDMQVGRAMVYIVAGAAAGSLGFAISSALSLGGVQDSLRWIAAIFIVATGLSIAGVLPPLRLLDRHAGLLLPVRKFQARSAFGFGAMLALAPCAMALNALLTATMLGSPLSGGIYMAGFSLAALPAVIVSALGIARLKAVRRQYQSRLRIAAGMALAITGMLQILMPGAARSQFCLG